MCAISRHEIRWARGLVQSYLKTMSETAKGYGRTMKRALDDPATEGLIRTMNEEGGPLRVLEMGCGRWHHAHAIALALAETFPGRELTMVGADPALLGDEGIERYSKDIVRTSGLARLIEAPLAIFRSQDVMRVLDLIPEGKYDMAISFNYLPFFRASHLGPDAMDAIRSLSLFPPEVQSSMFFHCMKATLSEGGLALVVSAQDFPLADLKLKEAGMEIILDRLNAEEDRGFPLNDRITVARKA